MKRLLWLVVLGLAVAAAAWAWQRRDAGQDKLSYQSEVLERGDVESVVSATGTLEATETVEVGSQVSGTIARIAVGYNDEVSQGQVLAVLDTELLDAAVTDAEAGVLRAKAQLEQAESDVQRFRDLFAKGFLAERDLRNAQTELRTAQTSLVSAESSLERASKNRRNAVILSPIDGVVIDRAVEVGQTVAASFNTPRLFTLARDLGRMQILASVDETDIGQIRPGLPARFTAAAFPDHEMEGEVVQVRLQPTTVQNVVTYTVVLSAANPDGLLLPGMTATVDFLVEVAKDVLSVPGAALRFSPPADVLAEMRAARRARRAGGDQGAAAGGSAVGPGGNRGQATGARRGSRPGSGEPGEARASGRMGGPGGLGGPGGPGGGQPGLGRALPPGVRLIWILNDEDQLRPRPVRLGASDGRRTAVQAMRGELQEGMRVVTGIEGQTTTTESSGRTSSPRRRRMPFFF